MSNNIKAQPYQPSENPKVFFQQVRTEVLAIYPYLVCQHQYSLKDLLTGTALWDKTGDDTHIRAGKSFSWMVDKGLADFKPAPRKKGQRGTRYYLYVGPKTYRGDE